MKKTIRFASIAVVAAFLFSCGNKEAAPNTEETKDTTEVAAAEEPQPEPEVVVEEMTLTFVAAKDPCFGNDAEYLIIKGGKAFEDEKKPYKTSAKTGAQSSVSFGKFVKNEDGSFKLEVMSNTNDIDSGKTTITVVDANGTEKTVSFEIPYCP
ncbi:VCBS repeat-containing protein [Dysgonomonas sp. PH5-45]|uniref:hypothetical protein n=1 Tax=unclassified Dysgonomonas TaxID=2630389 RepID=UPI0024770FD8|nr:MULTISPECIES: hypothetical protein [unclassified Dysgonomonas]MDH6354286.1 VCBS repeat-containing protein [Dysgonomonas sp. PH5-45]MDH6387187.1 VCBS repeat-containing protein [Dysgonomonas sp. PH5-37]